MGIRFNRFSRESFSKKARAYVDPKLVREAEIAREKAWLDGYLASHGIG